VVISNNRILNIEDGKVSFQWKDYRDHNRQKIMTLDADEFIRRFLMHVLPNGFQRIRYFGFLGNRYRKQKLERCRRLLNMPEEALHCEATGDYREAYEKLTGVSLTICPACRHGQMRVIEILQNMKKHPPPAANI
jgi:hypothetical protein